MMYYFTIILFLMMVMQAVVLPLILGAVSFISYHLARSAAFAVFWIPKSSYIRCSSVLALLLGMSVCLGNTVSIIFTILYSLGSRICFVNSRRIFPTWYFNACTLSVPNSSYACFTNGYLTAIRAHSSSWLSSEKNGRVVFRRWYHRTVLWM